MTSFVAGALVLGAVALSAGGPASAAMDGKDAIEKRVKFMKTEVLGPFKMIKGYVKEGKGSADEVAVAAGKLHTAAMKITGLFPKGTSRGDFDAKTTRALPKIWQDWKGFEAAAGMLAKQSIKLAAVAVGGDKAAIGKQFGMMGKMGCGGCHKLHCGDKVK
jgi:cytochrome c556